jgi:hypothetical protein
MKSRLYIVWVLGLLLEIALVDSVSFTSGVCLNTVHLVVHTDCHLREAIVRTFPI